MYLSSSKFQMKLILIKTDLIKLYSWKYLQGGITKLTLMLFFCRISVQTCYENGATDFEGKTRR